MSQQSQYEHKLISRLKSGDENAVQEWFQEYEPLVTQFVSAKISNVADVEEIVQQTFLNCLRHLPLFLGKSQIKTWMYSIARHEIADYYRKKYAKKALRTIPLSEFIPLESISDSEVVTEKVQNVFSHMRDSYSELLLLKYADNKKIAQIAQEVGKTEKAVESDLYRARKEFKSLWLALE